MQRFQLSPCSITFEHVATIDDVSLCDHWVACARKPSPALRNSAVICGSEFIGKLILFERSTITSTVVKETTKVRFNE